MGNENWLTFNRDLEKVWNDHASQWLSCILGRDVSVRLKLPSGGDAELCWLNNRRLCGGVDISTDDGENVLHSLKIPLPFDGVFVDTWKSEKEETECGQSDAKNLQEEIVKNKNPEERRGHARALVWESWLGEKPGVRLVFPSGYRNREEKHKVELRIGFPDGSYAAVLATDTGELKWDASQKEVDAFRDTFSRLRNFMPFGPLWGDAQSMIPEWLKPAFCGEEDVYEVVRSHANELAQPVDQDDLEHRVLVTFPRWLELRLCKLLFAQSNAHDKEKRDIFPEDVDECVAKKLVPLKGLTSKGCLVSVQPNNALEMMVAISSVKRYPFSRAVANNIPLDFRQNHPSFRGRLCPIETPESEMIGLSLQLARHARVNAAGEIVPATGAMDERGGAMGSVGWGMAMIPFAQYNDDARNMLGAKNLRQATPVVGRRAPCVKTGAEYELVGKMKQLASIGLCPSCCDAEGELALGRDLLVAYMPWYGWNVDDAMVVSRNVADDMAIMERKRFSREIGPEWVMSEKREDNCSPLRQGDVIVAFSNGDKNPFVVRYEDPNEARLSMGPIFFRGNQREVSSRLTYEIEKKVLLGLGDKLMGRHGNKGVVGKVVDEKEMPHLPDDPRLPKNLRGRAVDVLLNPHGVISRMNPGQLLETHLGWLLHSGIDKSRFLHGECSSLELGCIDNMSLNHDEIRKAFEETGLDRQGCVRLVLPDGSLTENPVLVGFEHIVRLHHVPEFKAQARRGGAIADYVPATRQATHGRRIGGGQRLGEMEVWALAAYGVPHILEEMLGAKADADWAKEWEGKGCPPAKELFSGFPGVLRDWLFALGIDMKRPENERGRVQFSIMKDDEIKKRIGGDLQRVTSAEGFRNVRFASFACEKGCDNPLLGQFEIEDNCKSLRLGSVLHSWGYDCSGPLWRNPENDRMFEWNLKRTDGDAVCTFIVTFKNYSPEKDWLDAEIVPKQGMRPLGWPTGMEKMSCRGRFCKRKNEIRRFGERGGKNIPADELLELLCETKSGRSLGDFSVTCRCHPSVELKLQHESAHEWCSATGSIFDHAIFGDWKNSDKDVGKWGYIELPDAIDYPCEALDGSFPKEMVERLPKLRTIPVLPMRYRRPIVCVDKVILDDITRRYLELTRECCKKGGGRLDKIKEAVEKLFEAIAKKLDKKEGLLRHEGLGRRVDRSFRLVITPNPKLEWDEAGVPTDVLWELLGDKVWSWWRQMGMTSFASLKDTECERLVPEGAVQRAGWYWKRSPSSLSDEDKYKVLCDYLDYLKEHRPVILLNRQPTLHRDGFQAFYPVPMKTTDGEVLQISPLCCKGFAADFDGDEMVGHYPVSDEAQMEARRLLPRNNLLQVGTGQSAAQYDRDLVTGLQIVYENKKEYEKKIDEIKLDGTLRKLLEKKYNPDCFGRELIGLLCKLGDENEAERMRVCQTITALSRLAYDACTRRGVSFGFYDLFDLCERFREITDKIEEKIDEVCKSHKISGLSTGALSVLSMVSSGANGRKQIHQIIGSRGELHVDCDHLGYHKSQIPEQARSFGCSLIKGMSWDEIFWTSLNARTTMCDKKLGAGKAGDLTRRLVFMLWPMGIKGLVAAQTIGERGLQVAMQGFHTGSSGVDIMRSRKLFLDGQRVTRNEDGTEVTEDFVEKGDFGGFKRAVFFDEDGGETEYANIKEEYLRILWEALKKKRASGKEKANNIDEADKAKIGEDGKVDFASLLFQGQKKQILELVLGGRMVSLDSPFAKVMFDLWGSRDESGLREEV